MTDLYETLCVVRTAIVNSIGEMTLTGSVVNYADILSDIAAEMEDRVDFIGGIQEMTDEELEDLGCSYLNADSNLMMFPLWLHKFIPEGTLLEDSQGGTVVVGEEPFAIYADNWIDAGIILT